LSANDNQAVTQITQELETRGIIRNDGRGLYGEGI
jgi:hypothetical protein